MVTSEMISETTAVALAGVSARTLSRFSEAGYLSIELRESGERYYSRSQLREIFGSFQGDTSEPEPTTTEIGTDNQRETPIGTYYSPVSPSPMVERASAPGAESVTSVPASMNVEEVTRLKNLVTLQEKILDMKDTEINDLRSQRDWLRTRVEKLEEKGDRDQVLLLNETQALRQLIGLQQQRRSSVRNILEWFGLASSESVRALPMNNDSARPTGDQGATIVMGKVANA